MRNLIIILSICCSPHLFAQESGGNSNYRAQLLSYLQTPAKPQRKQPAKQSPITPMQRSPINAPLLLSLDKLPANYRGDDIVEVIKRLDPGPKDEFETSAQYKSRMQSLWPNRTYSFWLDRPITRRYDADRQILKISIPTVCGYDKDGGVDCINSAALGIKTAEISRKEVGNNIFGGQRIIADALKERGVICHTYSS